MYKGWFTVSRVATGSPLNVNKRRRNARIEFGSIPAFAYGLPVATHDIVNQP